MLSLTNLMYVFHMLALSDQTFYSCAVLVVNVYIRQNPDGSEGSLGRQVAVKTMLSGRRPD